MMTVAASAPFGLSFDAWGRMVLIDAEGVRHVGVEPIRAFPLADPEQFISICDSEGREVVMVRNLSDLPAQVRQTLTEELYRREFMPVIHRIVRVATEAEPAEWVAETDRGPATFLINSADDVRRVSPDRVMVVDMQGVRYLIASVRKLDAHSRRILEHYI